MSPDVAVDDAIEQKPGVVDEQAQADAYDEQAQADAYDEQATKLSEQAESLAILTRATLRPLLDDLKHAEVMEAQAQALWDASTTLESAAKTKVQLDEAQAQAEELEARGHALEGAITDAHARIGDAELAENAAVQDTDLDKAAAARRIVRELSEQLERFQDENEALTTRLQAARDKADRLSTQLATQRTQASERAARGESDDPWPESAEHDDALTIAGFLIEPPDSDAGKFGRLRLKIGMALAQHAGGLAVLQRQIIDQLERTRIKPLQPVRRAL